MSNTVGKEGWNKRYTEGGNSGYGSYGTQAQLKLDRIRENVHDIESIVDIGCGDFAFSQRVLELFPNVDYLGLDVSDVIVEQNQKGFPKRHFEVLKAVDFVLGPADLLLCIDVLFHIQDEEECYALLQSIQRSWGKYLVMTACEFPEPPEDMANAASMFDYYQFGVPILRELVEPENTPYAYLYIWKK